MKTLLLGVGSVGEVIANHLVEDSRISLSILDVDEKRLKAVKRKLGKKVNTYLMDIFEPSDKQEILKEHDILINAATPSINLQLMNLCLKHGLHYIDLASDDVRKQLSKNRQWREKKLKAVICLGEDPGLSNIYAKYAAESLENVLSIKVRDGEFSISKKYYMVSLFSPQVFFQELFVPPYIFMNGRYRRLKPLSSREVYDFPEPINRQVVYTLNHEEVFTLPRFFKSVRYVDFKLNLSDEFVQTVKVLRRLGFLRAGKIRAGKSLVSPRDVFFTLIPKPHEIAGLIEGYAGIAVEVSGHVKGVWKTITVYTYLSHGEAYRRFGTNATAYLTGTVPAVVASMIARDMVDGSGVITPEELDAEKVIRAVGEKQIKTYVRASEEASLTK